MDIFKEGSVKEVQATKLSIHRNGKLILCCGSFSTLMLNLNDSKFRLKNILGNKSTEITACQWSKYGDNIAIALNNVCLVFDNDMVMVQSLKGHTDHPINSIDWHPGNKHQLISCSSGPHESICIWDVRQDSGPTTCVDMCATTTVQHVKWHKFNANIFAMSRNSDICFWDQRSLVTPISTVAAHETLVSDFDWLPREDHSAVSCGQYDCKMKLWNFTEDDRCPKFEIDEKTSLTHCKLNQTGDLLMSLTAPDSLGDNQLTLWDTFSGYDAQKLNSLSFIANHVTAFDWIELSWDKHQIFSLHKNYEYKVWDVDKSSGIIKNRRRDSSIKMPRDSSLRNDRFYLSPSPQSGAELSNTLTTVFSETFSNTHATAMSLAPRYSDSNLIVKPRVTKISSSDIDTKIQKEFDRLSNNVQITYEKALKERKVIANLSLINAKCSIMFTYREAGPDNVLLEPTLLSEKSERLRKQNLDELEKILKNGASSKSYGISKCVDLATDYINKLSARVNIRSVRSMKDNSATNSSYRNLPDVKVPFPRTCGAKFSPCGLLVCFLLPPGFSNKFHTTPRSFVDIAKHSSNSATTGKDFFYSFNFVTNKTVTQRTFKPATKKNKILDINGDIEFPSRIHSLTNVQKHVFNVHIYNAQRLSLFCPLLAKKYSIDVSDVETLCERNLDVIADSNRKDLAEFWQYCAILAHASRPSANDFNNQIKPWPSQLLGRQMCNFWLEHFLKILDIQSAAMLILVMMAIDARFDSDFETKYTFIINNSKTVSPESIQENQCPDNAMNIYQIPSYNRYSGDVRNYFMGQNRHYSNSFGDAEHQCGMTRKSDKQSEMIFRHRENCRLIDQSKLPQYGLLLLHYSRMLSAQSLLTAATKITRKVLPVTFFNNMCNMDQFSVRFMPTLSDQQYALQYGRLAEPSHQVMYSECPDRGPPSDLYQDAVARLQVLCCVCRLSVHGLLSLCSQCNHGGHIDHLTAWFSRENSQGFCATGCGCQCAGSADNVQEILSPPITV